MKRGLAIISAPQNLHQFIWYYCNQGKEIEWDALCIPNDDVEMMHEDCERAGIFSEIYIDDCAFQFLPMKRQLYYFGSMFWYFFTFRRKKFCRKILNERIEWEKYDEVVVLNALGVVYGACVALGEEKKVVILEDGTGDYTVRKKWMNKDNIVSSREWKGFILSHMGYCCPGWFHFEPEKYCIKYSASPERMQCHNYKEIRRLFADEGTDKKLYAEIIEKLYPQLQSINFEDIDAILFTEPLEDYTNVIEDYVKKVEKYIGEEYKTILLKRHPRENTAYNFGEHVKVHELNKEIPGEVLLPLLKGKDVLLFECCSIIVHLKAYGLQCVILHFDKLRKDSIKANPMFIAPSYEMVEDFVKKFNGDNYKIEVL